MNLNGWQSGTPKRDTEKMVILLVAEWQTRGRETEKWKFELVAEWQTAEERH